MSKSPEIRIKNEDLKDPEIAQLMQLATGRYRCTEPLDLTDLIPAQIKQALDFAIRYPRSNSVKDAESATSVAAQYIKVCKTASVHKPRMPIT